MLRALGIKVRSLSRTPPVCQDPQRHSQDRQEGITNPLTDRATRYILNGYSKVNSMVTQSITEESQFLLDEIFQGDTVAESICLRDLIQWAGENPITMSTEDLAQLVIYSEDKLRELYDIYCDVAE